MDVSSDDELFATVAAVLRDFIAGNHKFAKTVTTRAFLIQQHEGEDSEGAEDAPMVKATRHIYRRAVYF